MNQCVNCGTELPKGAKFCSNCGTKAAEERAANYCRECGAGLKSGAKFCHACGQTTGGAETAVTAGGNDHSQEFETPAAAAPRSWKAILLSLVGIPALIGILFLLTYKQKNPAPMSQSQMSGAAPAGSDGQGVDMAAMDNVRKQIDKYKSDLTANPKDTSALLALGGMYEIAGRFDEAADYFKRYLEVVPGNAAVRMNLAGVYYNNAQQDPADSVRQTSFYQQAQTELRQVLKYQPTYDYAMFNLAVIYLAEGKKDEAIKWWHKVMETNPNGELAQKAREEIQKAGGK
jgi:tetratricopeptide (TPR) repeat protein